ncbi:hypothetical protein R1flu_014982 [Riccia fluitans]|uniref:Uncharacterized protein n=1 Tax=Riccia fluitans TaxID=41844 RepID=A0ABD1YHM9_9MARC
MTIDNRKQAHTPMEKVFSMQRGTGENSYAKNSNPQQFLVKNIIAPELLQALDKVTLPDDGQPVVIADLGCSTGWNTINNMNLIVDHLKERLATAADSNSGSSNKTTEFHVFFNDLPSNDFNHLFQLLNENRDSLDYFAAGVSGSFYGRLFPRSSVHVFFSSHCLHYISKIPDAVLDKNSPAFNKGDMWLVNERNEVGAAYKEQADLDLKRFLRARAEEMTPGGLLFMLFSGRGDSNPARQWPENSFKREVWKCMNESWDCMVTQGHITEDQRDSFNVPLYSRSIEEVQEAIESCSSAFRIEKMIVQQMRGTKPSEIFPNTPTSDLLKRKVSFMKSLHNPLVEAHIGTELARLYWEYVEIRMSVNKIDDLMLTLESNPNYKQHNVINTAILMRL